MRKFFFANNFSAFDFMLISVGLKSLEIGSYVVGSILVVLPLILNISYTPKPE